MAKFNVRSNCIAPFAWSRMIGSIPTETPEQKARVEKLKQMETGQDRAARGVPGQRRGAATSPARSSRVRANEIFLMSQTRPMRSVHRGEGWTPETIAAHAMPALKAHFYALDRSQDVFSWDPL